MSDEDTTQVDADLGISRRQLLRRGAIVGGTVAWSAPIIQSVTRPAFGQDGTPACRVTLCALSQEPGEPPTCQCQDFNESPECCDCLEENQGAGILAALICEDNGSCSFDESTRSGDPYPCS